MSDKLPDTAIELFKYNIDVQMDRGISLRNRTFTVTGEINTEMFHRVDGCLSIFEEENGKAITMRFCSGGGDIYAALAIIGRIKSSKCKIRIEAYGQIMSAATAIFAVGDTRVAAKHTTFMFHQTSLEMPSQNLRDVRAELEQSERDDQLFNEILAKHSKRDFGFWSGLIKGGQNSYHSAEQCMVYGLVDKII